MMMKELVNNRIQLLKGLILFLLTLHLVAQSYNPDLLQCTLSVEKDTFLIVKPKFDRPTNKREFPAPYKVLDSLFVEFYDWVKKNPEILDKKRSGHYIEEFDKIHLPQEMLKAFAKAILWSRFYSDSIRHEYITLANVPSDEQIFRLKDMKKEGGIKKREGSFILPSWCLNIYFDRQISKRMPWMWHYLIKTGYILVVEPFTNQKNLIIDSGNPDSQMNRSDYYGCYVKDDIIGNFNGPQKITITAAPNKYILENGKQYLVVLSNEHLEILLKKENHIDGIYHEYSAIDWITKNQAIFEVIDGKIIDYNQLLYLGQKLSLGAEFTVDLLKQKVQILLKDMMGEYYEIK